MVYTEMKWLILLGVTIIWLVFRNRFNDENWFYLFPLGIISSIGLFILILTTCQKMSIQTMADCSSMYSMCASICLIAFMSKNSRFQGNPVLFLASFPGFYLSGSASLTKNLFLLIIYSACFFYIFYNLRHEDG